MAIRRNFWSPVRDRYFLEEIILARKFAGEYVSFQEWNNPCYRHILSKLTRRDGEFAQLTPVDLKKRITYIREETSVIFLPNAAPPEDEFEKLVYEAFHEEMKHAPKSVKERKVREVRGGVQTVNLNMNKQQTSTHTTNLNSHSGSCSNRKTLDEEALLDFLCNYKAYLEARDANAYAYLCQHQKLGVLKRHNELMLRDDFLREMIKFNHNRN